MPTHDYRFLTRKMQSYQKISVIIGRVFRCHSYRWNHRTNQIERDRANWFKWINYLIHFSHAFFVFFKAYEAYQDPAVGVATKVVSQFISVYWVLPLGLIGALETTGEANETFILKSSGYLKKASLEQPPSIVGRPKKPLLIFICEVVLDMSLSGIAAINMLITTWAFLFPYFPTSVVPTLVETDPRSVPLGHRVISATVVGYNCWIFFSQGYLLMMNYVVGLIGLLAVIKEYRVTHFKKLSSESVSRYLHVQLILKLFNDAYSTLVLPSCEVTFISLCMFGLYGVVKFDGLVALTVGFTGAWFYNATIVIFRMAAEFHLKSLEILGSWRSSPTSDLYQRKLLRSMRPAKVILGSYCFVDTRLVLTMTEIIVTNAANLMLVSAH